MGVVLRRGGAWAVDMEQHGGRPAVPRPLFKMGSGSVERVPKGTPAALHAFQVSDHKACSATSQSLFRGSSACLFSGQYPRRTEHAPRLGEFRSCQ